VKEEEKRQGKKETTEKLIQRKFPIGKNENARGQRFTSPNAKGKVRCCEGQMTETRVNGGERHLPPWEKKQAGRTGPGGNNLSDR